MSMPRPTAKKLLGNGLLAAAALISTTAPASLASDVPDFMKVTAVDEGPPPSKSQIALNDVNALNDAMFPIYDQSLRHFTENFRARHNLIMALFSGKGGRFILYRAGKPPLEAESPPAVYRMAKSVGHCAMIAYDLVAPYCGDSQADLSWRGEMEAYRTRVKTALLALDACELKDNDRELLKDSLRQILAFMDKCLAANSFTYADVESYARGIKPNLAKMIQLCADTQVGHWFKVMDQWKAMLGPDWADVYGLTNTIYVARQNNILFSVLVQYMGEKAMNDHLLLLETTDFTATPEDMMGSFMRIVSDRALGQVFYKDYRLMDSELLGGGGRHAIEAECAKRGLKPILPPLVPYNSTQWPMKIDPNSGTGPGIMEDIH